MDIQFPELNNIKDNIDFFQKLRNQLNNTESSDTEESVAQEGVDEEYCSICEEYNMVQIDGYYTCNKCGNQDASVIDNGQEWRYYGQFDNKSSDPARCGIPTNDLVPNSCIGSVISSNWNESWGMKRIRKIQSWNSISYRDTTLMNSFNNITNVASSSGIPNCIIEESKVLYKTVTDIKSYKKAKKEAMQAACVQWACKMKGFPRDSSEMAIMFGIEKKDMRKAAKQFEEIWNTLKIQQMEKSDIQQEDISNFKPSTSTDYLHRSCSKLNVSDDIYQICKEVSEYIESEDHLTKHIPLSRTAGCIYFTYQMLNIDIDKNSITNVCNVSEVTINKCYQKLLKINAEIIENTSLSNYIN